MFQLIKYNAFLLVPFDPSTKELVLGEIFEVLRDIAVMWRKLGVFLGIPHHTIREIHSDDVEMHMYDQYMYKLLPVLYEWISSKPEEATIDNLISAIHLAVGRSLAYSIEHWIRCEMAMYQGSAHGTNYCHDTLMYSLCFL